jgi:hypothetical protein
VEELEGRVLPATSLSLPSAGFAADAEGGTILGFPININQLQDGATPTNHVGLRSFQLALSYPLGVFVFPVGGNAASSSVHLGSVPLSDTAAPGGAADWSLIANSPFDGALNITVFANTSSQAITTNNPASGGSLVTIDLPISSTYSPSSATAQPIRIEVANGTFITGVGANNGNYILGPVPPYVGSVTINPAVTVTMLTLPNWTQNLSGYSQTISASGGTGALTFSAFGSLPPGLTLSSGGVLSGTPTTAGTYNFTVTASDNSSGTWTTLAYPGVLGNSYAAGISGNNVVGGYEDGTLNHGFLFNGSSYSMFDDPAGPGSTFLGGISGSNIVGTYNDGPGYHGFLYDGSSFKTLDAPGASLGTYASGVSGSYIVGYYRNNTDHGFLYNGSTYTTLDYPGSSSTDAVGVSGSNVVGHYNDGTGIHGFVYDGSRYKTLDAPGANLGTYATGISGSYIVGYYDIRGSDGADLYQGFVYNGFTYTTLNDPGSPFGTFGQGISGGTVVGFWWGALNYGFSYKGPLAFNSSQNYTVVINPPVTVTTATLPNGTAGTAYNQTITATGGAGTYTFSQTASGLPAWLTLSNAGVLSGTPTGAGNYTIAVTATDTLGASATQNYSLTVGAGPLNQYVVQAASTVQAGSSFQVTVQASDQYGNLITNYSGPPTRYRHHQPNQ